MFSLHFRTYPTSSSQNCPSENTAFINGWVREVLIQDFGERMLLTAKVSLQLISIGRMDRSILFIYANRFKGIETGF